MSCPYWTVQWWGPYAVTFYSLKTCGRKVWSYEAKLSISGSPHRKCQHWIELWTGHCGGKPYILVKCGEALFSADWIRKKNNIWPLLLSKASRKEAEPLSWVQCIPHMLCYGPPYSTPIQSVLFSVCFICLWVAWEQAVISFHIPSPSHVIGTQHLFNDVKIKLPQLFWSRQSMHEDINISKKLLYQCFIFSRVTINTSVARTAPM